MKPRQIWFWTVLAAGLFGFIFFFQRYKPPATPWPRKALASVQGRRCHFHPGSAIRSGLTRHSGGTHEPTWQLVEPLVYAAQGTNIERLLDALESLTPATFIAPSEIRNRPKAEEEFGFAAPQASIIVQQPGYRAHLLVGSFTAPGDQVFLQVVAREGVYVVDAELLKLVPRSVNQWRDTALIAGDPSLVDRIAVTNRARAFVLQRDTNTLWKMVWPLSSARADNARTEEALQRLAQLRIRQFITDDSKPELEALGLLRPPLELALSQGTNAPALLQFGKAVTTATNEVYARRLGQNAIFTVSSDGLSPWRNAAVNEFRDPHLLTLTDAVAALEVHGTENFIVQRQTNDVWRVLPNNSPADAALVSELLFALTSIQIVQFTKDVVNPPELPEFGLASPALNYSLLSAPAASASGSAGQPAMTNCVIVGLDFGLATNVTDKVFVRRRDEGSVYAISTNDFARLPSAAWQLRERKLWDVTENEIAGLIVRQNGKKLELIRRGDHLWSVAPGSQGIINDLAVEQTVRGLAHASARQWVCARNAKPGPIRLG